MADFDAQKRQFLQTLSAITGAVVLPTGLAACGGGGGSEPTSIADKDVLWKWVKDMVDMGPRFTAGPAHRRWLDYLVNAFSNFGLQVNRYPMPVRYWEASKWSLQLTDSGGALHDIPVAYYVPYAGETTAAGITAGVVDVGAGNPADYAGKAVGGKIVLMDRSYPNLTIKQFVGPVISTIPADLAAHLGDISFLEPWVGGLNLSAAKAQGAAAAIIIMDMPPEAAINQFTPHQQKQFDLPAVNLDRVQGQRLRAILARGPVEAKLVLQAQRDDQAKIDFLSAKLPGSGKHKGAVAVLTHTDGQNATEENAAAALLSMARYFSSLPRDQRARDIYFLLSPAHMKPESDGLTPQDWLNANPDIKNDIAAVFTIEHLGAMEWTVSADRTSYAATGNHSFYALGVANSDALKSVAASQLAQSNLQRIAFTGPPADNFYGEGTSTQRAGLPSLCLIAGPAYLVQISDDGGLGKLDPSLFYDQTVFCTKLVEAMIGLEKL